MTDAALATLWRDLYDSDDVTFYVAAELPQIVQIVDGTVGIGLVDAAENPRGWIITDDTPVPSDALADRQQ